MTQYTETFRAYIDRSIQPYLSSLNLTLSSAEEFTNRILGDIDKTLNQINTVHDDIKNLKDEVHNEAEATKDYYNKVQGLYTELSHIYLGEYDHDPDKNSDGSPLIPGATYFNTKTERIRIWTSPNNDGNYQWVDSDIDAQNILQKILSYAETTKQYRDESKNLYNDIKNIYGQIQVPTGVNNTYPHVKGDGSGWEFYNPDQVRDNIGAAPKVNPEFSGYAKYNVNPSRFGNSDQVATLGCIRDFKSGNNPVMNGDASPGNTGDPNPLFSLWDHRHPRDDSKAQLNGDGNQDFHAKELYCHSIHGDGDFGGMSVGGKLWNWSPQIADGGKHAVMNLIYSNSKGEIPDGPNMVMLSYHVMDRDLVESTTDGGYNYGTVYPSRVLTLKGWMNIFGRLSCMSDLYGEGKLIVAGHIYANGGITSANADIAEYYLADEYYLPGTVLSVGGDKEVTVATEDSIVMGVVSTEPSILLNRKLEEEPLATKVALCGRVPVKVTGKIKKGQGIKMSSLTGVGTVSENKNDYFAIALESSDDEGVKLIESILKK